MANGEWGKSMNGQPINSYRDLHVWQDAMTLAELSYKLTRNFPKSELFGFTSQIRRAATSIPANIAEGHGRESTGSFIQFLRIAQGSTKELETHFLLAVRVDLTTEQEADALVARCESIGKRLRSLIRSLQEKA
jgi:four helix bundle protein